MTTAAVAHDPIAEAAWVASHEYIARTVARRRARFAGRDDLLDDYRQVGRLALVEAFRAIGDQADAEAYARAAVERRTSRLWITFEAVRPPKRGGRPIAVESVEGVEIEDREGRRMNEVKETVEHALEELTDEEKDVVLYRFGVDCNPECSTAEVAKTFNMSESTVRRTLRSAIDKMRAMVEREEVEG